MAKYFKVVAIIEFVAFGISVPFVIYLFFTIPKDGFVIFCYVFGFILYLFLGPSAGLLFLSHSKLLEKKDEEQEDKEVKEMQKIISDNLKCKDGFIYIKGAPYKMDEIEDLERIKDAIAFKTNEKQITIRCQNEEVAEILYQAIKNYLKQNK